MLSYSDPRGLAFVFCICAKCGSSSFYRATWEALTGVVWPNTFDVHQYERWSTLPECGPSCQRISDSKWLSQRPDFQIWLSRDPVDRLVSAYHSKVKCCPSQKKREACYRDENDKFVPALARLAGMEPQRCFHFDEYASALSRVYDLQKQADLDNHFRPQHMACPLSDDVPVLMMNVSQFADFANDFNFLVDEEHDGRYPLHVTHQTDRGNFSMSSTDFTHLLKATKDEYNAMKRKPWPKNAYAVRRDDDLNTTSSWRQHFDD